MTYFLFILSIFIWPFGQLLTFTIPGLSLSFYLLDISVGLLSLSLFLSSKSRNLIFSNNLFKSLLVFLLVASLSLLFNLQLAISGGFIYPIFYLLRLFIYPSVYFAARIYPRSAVTKPIVLSMVLFVLIGLGQYLFFPDMRYLRYLGFDDHYYRLIGSFYDPNFTGAIVAGLSLALIASGQFLLSLPFIGLLSLTFSRTSYLCFAFGLIYLLLKNRQKKVLILLIALVVIVVLIPKPFGEGVNLMRTVSILSRFESWHQGFLLFLQKPILGWGYNTLRVITGSRFQIDNSYLYVAATTGILGVLSFGFLLHQVWISNRSLSGSLVILTILAHSFFNNSLFYIWIFYAFWIAAGLSSKEYKRDSVSLQMSFPTYQKPQS